MKLPFFKVSAPVNAIINSLTNPAEYWDCGRYYIFHKRSGLKLWTANGITSVHEYRGDGGSGLSFTAWEKRKVWKAIKVANGNRVMQMLNTNEEEEK